MEEECKTCELQERLNKYIKDNTEQNCDQRSDEWYRQRQFSFGGSDLANLMGLGKKLFQTQEQFFQDKFNAQTGVGKFIEQRGQTIMDWGTFFEPVHRMILESEFDCQITEASMCKGQDILKGCHQSPDGLGVMRSQVFKTKITHGDIINKRLLDQEKVAVLFEQKSPYMRKIVYDCVPEKYIGQIKLGLAIFPICDIACYSESLFRICTVRQLQTKTYNSSIIVQRKPLTQDPDPMYVGIVEFDDLGKESMQLQIGDVSSEFNQVVFQKMMDLLRVNSTKLQHHIYKYSELNTLKKKAKELTDNQRSYICWKLVDMQHTAVERSQGFEKIVSMFVSLGYRALMQFNESKTQPTSLLRDIKEFTNSIKKLGLPLLPGNHQDAWYYKYEEQLIKLYESYLIDDWQSFYVLLSLMKGSKSDYLRARIDNYIKRATEACKDDAIKIKMLDLLTHSLSIPIKNEQPKGSESNTISNTLNEGIVKDMTLLSIGEEVALGVSRCDSHQDIV